MLSMFRKARLRFNRMLTIARWYRCNLSVSNRKRKKLRWNKKDRNNSYKSNNNSNWLSSNRILKSRQRLSEFKIVKDYIINSKLFLYMIPW